MGSLTPAVIDALVDLALESVPADVAVYDSHGVSESTSDFIMIGVESPDENGLLAAADSSHTWTGLGNRARDQEGDVWCYVAATDGDAVAKVARDRAYRIVHAFESAVRADPTLGGVLTSGWARFGSSEVLNQAVFEDAGAVAEVTFQIHFQGRVPE